MIFFQLNTLALGGLHFNVEALAQLRYLSFFFFFFVLNLLTYFTTFASGCLHTP
ncbi:hypothetical protein GIB67_029897, partial [Kingdonia uniflora]